MKPPTGQKLADAMADMMGWILDEGEWCARDAYGDFIYQKNRKLWKPHLNYDSCRIVEDWIWENGRWGSFLHKLYRIKDIPYLRTTPLQRCQAAWMAWKDQTDEKPTPAQSTQNTPT